MTCISMNLYGQPFPLDTWLIILKINFSDAVLDCFIPSIERIINYGRFTRFAFYLLVAVLDSNRGYPAAAFLFLLNMLKLENPVT